jgi:hypothetical protein
VVALARTVTYLGLEARAVEVQCQVAPGLPRFNIVGLADKAVGGKPGTRAKRDARNGPIAAAETDHDQPVPSRLAQGRVALRSADCAGIACGDGGGRWHGWSVLAAAIHPKNL